MYVSYHDSGEGSAGTVLISLSTRYCKQFLHMQEWGTAIIFLILILFSWEIVALLWQLTTETVYPQENRDLRHFSFETNNIRFHHTQSDINGSFNQVDPQL